jgi:hypothetical protein
VAGAAAVVTAAVAAAVGTNSYDRTGCGSLQEEPACMLRAALFVGQAFQPDERVTLVRLIA